MLTQNLNVRADQKGIIPVVHMVQGDSGRRITCILQDYDIPSGSSASLSIERPDGNVYIASATISNNNVSANITTTMLNVVGIAKATMHITSSGSIVSTFEFVIKVEEAAGFAVAPSPADNSVYVYINGSQVKVLTSADLEDYYTKDETYSAEEIDDKIEQATPSDYEQVKSTVSSLSESIAKISDAMNEVTTVNDVTNKCEMSQENFKTYAGSEPTILSVTDTSIEYKHGSSNSNVGIVLSDSLEAGKTYKLTFDANTSVAQSFVTSYDEYTPSYAYDGALKGIEVGNNEYEFIANSSKAFFMFRMMYNVPSIIIDNAVLVDTSEEKITMLNESKLPTIPQKVQSIESDVSSLLVPIENISEYSDSNFTDISGSGTSSRTYADDGVTISHGSANDYYSFCFSGLDVEEHYKFTFHTTGSLNKAFISSANSSAPEYALSEVLNNAVDDVTLEFDAIEDEVFFVIRLFYNVSSTVISASDCRRTGNRYINVSNFKRASIPLDKIGFDFVENPSLYIGKEFATFDKCLCIGDSLTAGTFNFNEGGAVDYEVDARYSYPTYLKKMYGIETTNKGDGGKTCKTWYQNHSNDDISGHDVCIIALGANDASLNVAKSETIEYLQRIIDLVKQKNSKIKIFICTLLPAYYWELVTSYPNTNDAIKQVCNANSNCYLVDLTSYSICKRDTKYAQGHLTAIGYMQEASEIFAIASYIMKNSDLNEFRYIQFINTNHSHT